MIIFPKANTFVYFFSCELIPFSCVMV